MNSLEIKVFRDKHGLTQSQLADLVGVKIGTVSKWEQGKRNISPSIVKLMSLYQIDNTTSDKEELLSEDNNETDFLNLKLDEILNYQRMQIAEVMKLKSQVERLQKVLDNKS